MKRFLLISSALILALPAVAQAQQRPPQQTKPARPGRPGARPPGNQRPPAARPPGNQRPPAARPPQHRPGTRPPGNQRPPVARPPQHRPPGGRPPAHRPPVHRPGAGRPPHFRPIHRPVFHYPRGYSYRRWRIGLILPRLFLASPYYFDDWAPLGVGAPPPGYRWVRYGPDLLLVQLGSGRIADVIYGAFY
jgi:Ni/Co efflux regulator RcnB